MQDIFLDNKRITLVIVVVTLIVGVQCISHAQGSPKIYWTEADKIKRANLDGSNVEDVITELVCPYGIALDLRNRKMYWITRKYENIYRANLDGTDIETILNRDVLIKEQEKRIPSPCSLAIDTQASKIYWGNQWPPWGIMRADYNGENIEDFRILPVNGGFFDIRVDAEDIKLDLKAGKIYFQDSLNDNLACVDMDGSNYKNLPLTTPHHDKIALDLINKKLYLTQAPFGKILTATLQGENIEDFLTDLFFPTEIVLDIHSQKIYWIEKSDNIKKSKIRRCNLDGTNIIDIFTGLEYIDGLAIDTEGVYDVSPDENKLTTAWANMKTVE